MKLICIECPMGCEIEVNKDDEGISIVGNGCLRGKLYAQNEITCPRRVLTTSVRAKNGKMVSVKTEFPIKKEQVMEAMGKINQIEIGLPVKIGQVIVENLTENINLIATCNAK